MGVSRLITPEQLAERWATSRSYLANLRCQGKGCPYVKLGRRVMYRETDVARYELDRRVVAEFVKPKVSQ
jgi:helix-turn-helix protein